MRRVDERRRARERVRSRPRGGQAGVRRLARADGEGCGLRSPRRSAADGRRPGHRMGARRARLQLSAPPSEGRRGIGKPGSDPRAGARVGGIGGQVGQGSPATAAPGPSSFCTSPTSAGSRSWRSTRRLQVEHPVTEMVTGVDLVKLQLDVAAGGTAGGRASAPERPRDRGAPERRGPGARVRAHARDGSSLLRLPGGPGMRVDSGFAEGDWCPPQFDSMIAKIIAHGRTREEAIARLRRAIADTMVVIEEGATNQGFLLELLGRDELRNGEVDTGWLDRLQGQGEVQSKRHADVALVRAAIELCDDATAKERGRFYAFARRGRPEACAEVWRNVDLRYPGRELPLRRSRRWARTGTCSRSTAARIEAELEQRLRARAADPLRRRLVSDADRAAGRGPAGRGRRRAPPRLARRGRADSLPQPRSRGRDPRVTRRRGQRRRRACGDGEHEDGVVADRAGAWPRARGARVGEHTRSGRAGRWCRSSRWRTTGCRRGRAASVRQPADPTTHRRATASRRCWIGWSGSARLRRAPKRGAGRMLDSCWPRRAIPTASCGCWRCTRTFARSAGHTAPTAMRAPTRPARSTTCRRSCGRSTQR